MLPTREGLDPDNLACFGRDLRLEPCSNLAEAKRVQRIFAQLGMNAVTVQQGGGLGANPAGTNGRCVIKRADCGAQPALPVGSRNARRKAKTNRDRRVNCQPFDRHGFVQPFLYARGNLQTGFKINGSARANAGRKSVGVEPGGCVACTHGPFQTVKQLGANLRKCPCAVTRLQRFSVIYTHGKANRVSGTGGAFAKYGIKPRLNFGKITLAIVGSAKAKAHRLQHEQGQRQQNGQQNKSDLAGGKIGDQTQGRYKGDPMALRLARK
jgi:hypothetical protein